MTDMTERVRETVARLRRADEYEPLGHDGWEAADLLEALAAALEREAKLKAALEFYADKTPWNQPPVKTREGLFSVEYENTASMMQKDRGKIARAALGAQP